MTIAGASQEMIKSYQMIEKDYHTLKTPDKDQSVYKQKKFTQRYNNIINNHYNKNNEI